MDIRIVFHPRSLRVDLVVLHPKWRRLFIKLNLEITDSFRNFFEYLISHPSAYLQDQIYFLYDTFNVLVHKSILSRMIKAKGWTKVMVSLFYL